MLKTFYDSLLAVVYPQTCLVCENSVENSSGGVVCRDCWQNTRIFSDWEVLCGKCGAYLRESGKAVETFCHRCDEHFYDAAKAVGIYEKALAASIISLKRNPSVSKNLQKHFISAFESSNFQTIDLIIPVPLSQKRFLERGYNQAEILSRILSKAYCLTTDEKSFTRKLDTPMHRAAMDEKARQLTVKNAFEVKRPNLIKDKNILLVDDVFTSGATASACAKELKKAGAKKVYVFTIARAN